MGGSARKLVTVVAITGALCFTAVTPAGAAATLSDPIATGLAGPLSIAVGGNGNLYVGQAFAGLLTRIEPDGTRTDLYAAPIPGTGVEGVSVSGGQVTFTETVFPPSEVPVLATSALLKRRFTGGFVKTLADLREYEVTRNPDQHQTYGFRHLSHGCAAQLPPDAASYKGLVDTHPYGTALHKGDTYVAEAGGNAILRVSDSGHVSTVAVLPAVPFRVTAEAAEAQGLPKCTIGKSYWFEPVPTDVEVGRDGSLYVSLLPGGPEDDSLGARGTVVRVNPHTGHVRTIAKGFAGATNVALSPTGKVFVAELAGNQVSLVKHGRAVHVADVPEPAGLEWKQQKLFVSYNVFTDGAVATINR